MTSVLNFQLRDGKKISKWAEYPLEAALEAVVDAYQQQIDKKQKKIIILRASTGVSKSTAIILKTYYRNPHLTFIISQVTVTNTIGIADYIAKHDKMEMGRNVGYSTSLAKVAMREPGLMYQTMKTTTNQYLHQMLYGGRAFPDHVIVIDEAHTNSIEMLEQLAYVRQVALQVPESMRPWIIVQSASIDIEQMSAYLNTDFIIDVVGTRFPIIEMSIDDMGPAFQDRHTRSSVSKCATECVRQILNHQQHPHLQNVLDKHSSIDPKGPILIFVPTSGMMETIAEDMKILDLKIPLELVTSSSIQKDLSQKDRVQAPDQKVILATNVIETGFTIKNLSFVIDTAKFQLVYYDPVRRSTVSRLHPIDKSMMQQRRGRVGRTNPGIYIALTDRSSLQQVREQLPIPSMHTSDIKQNIFAVGYEAFNTLVFLYPPMQEQLQEALQCMVMMRYNPQNPGDYFWLIRDKGHKLPLQISYFITVGLELKLRVLDIVLMGVLLDQQIDRDTKELIRGKPNQVWELFKLASATKPSQLNYNILASMKEVLQVFINKGYDLLCGKKLTEQRTVEVVFRAFIHNIVIKHDGQYKSMYSPVSVSDRKCDVFIATDFEDRRQVAPKLAVNIAITPDQAHKIIHKFCSTK